ncbi:hypothetical protein ACFVIM_02320 [Streptomyces sp. NPDC057638]|uniref:hypothetical protein n=1 Tax=Streptomyces sp. NPDC057638 TaxID=3346190 RepID=UPI0036C20224
MKIPSKEGLIVICCGLLPSIPAGIMHWSAVRWGATTAVVLAAAALVVVGRGRSPQPSPAPPPMSPEPVGQPTYQETEVRNVRLPSALEGYDFLFSAAVWWYPVDGATGVSYGNLPGLAAAAVLNRARAITREEHPGHTDFTRRLLEGALSVPYQDGSALVCSRVAHVTLTLSPDDQDRLTKLRDLRKGEESRERERQYERQQRTYLADEVLNSTGSAVVWWLARHDGDVEKTVGMIGPLAQVSAAANDTEVPEIFRHLVVRPTRPEPVHPVEGPTADAAGDQAVVGRITAVLDDLGLTEGSDRRMVLVHRIARSMEAAGLRDTADHLRSGLVRPAAPDPATDTPDTAAGDGDPLPSPEAPSAPVPSGPITEGAGPSLYPSAPSVPSRADAPQASDGYLQSGHAFTGTMASSTDLSDGTRGSTSFGAPLVPWNAGTTSDLSFPPPPSYRPEVGTPTIQPGEDGGSGTPPEGEAGATIPHGPEGGAGGA